MSLICGVDIGGTFTDTVVVDERGGFVRGKASSTPPNFGDGFFNSLASAAEQLGISARELFAGSSHIFHGTTVATNAMVQLRGARVGLLTTRGHRDTLSIMRTFGRVAGLDVEELVHFASTKKPAPIVPRSLIGEIEERIDCKGEIVVPQNERQARDAIRRLVDEGVEAIAICLLWSFLNPAHEQRLLELVREEAPDLFVCASSDLVPKWGEYERTAATAINAFVGPVIDRYLTDIETRLAAEGFEQPILVMQCGGGVAPSLQTRRQPLLTMQSGPVGGAIGSAFLGGEIGEPNMILTDMGGTSFDVGLVADGSPISRDRSVVNQYQYYVPTVDIESIGAGGGSIAWFDRLSRTLKVGPDSAGADPGPACYGRGEQPTVTDAGLVLGYIDPDYFLGGKIRLDRDRSVAAIEKLAAELDMSVLQTAGGIARIVDAHMADLIRKMTINRGYDPREFVLSAYGGAGPVHASGYARELDAKTVIVPLASTASTWSAFGVASADILHIYEVTEIMAMPVAPAHVRSLYAGLEERASAQLEEEGIAPADRRLERFADVKYRAQMHEVEVPLQGGELDAAAIERCIAEFERRYEQLYGEGAGFSGAGIEFVALRLRAHGATPKPTLEPRALAAGNGSAPELVQRAPREVWWYELEEALTTPVYDGTSLYPGASIDGPTIVDLPETTVVVRPAQTCRMDEFGNLHISL